MTGKRITTWVVIKPNNALRERIQAWALQQKLDMDALQAAALKARRLRQAMARGLPRASSDTKLSHQPSSGYATVIPLLYMLPGNSSLHPLIIPSGCPSPQIALPT